MEDIGSLKHGKIKDLIIGNENLDNQHTHTHTHSHRVVIIIMTKIPSLQSTFNEITN